MKLFGRCDVYSKFGDFGVCLGSKKCDNLGQKKIIILKTTGSSQVKICSGTNDE